MGIRRILLIGTAIPLAASLAACGGGGGSVNSTPTPTPSAVPAPPPPPPPPPPVNYDTQEYRDSNGARSARAIAAYNAGATGAGITAAIIDSGINPALSEFAGRISSASADTAGTRGLGDDDGHGTSVAAVVAAARNGSGMHGVAFNSTLLIARTDTPGSCTDTSGPMEEQGCSHNDNSVARGIDLAVANNARVINISLGGSAANSTLRAAISRATAAGVVIVISAGNDGAKPEGANPDPLAGIALDPVARGLVIIAGAVDVNEQIAGFSNRAGNAASQYLAALGVQVRTINENGTLVLASGTSYAAPVISGAVALLAQAFPNLTGRQIVELLFNSARDLGSLGDDSIYGQGVIDLERAFQPQGSLSLAGSGLAVMASANATTSAPMGDGGQGAQIAAVVLDGYDRAYAMDLGGSVRTTRPAPALAGAFQRGNRSLSAVNATTAVSLSVTDNGYWARDTRLLLTGQEAEMARATAGFVASRIDARTQIALGFSTSAGTITAHLRGKAEPAFLIADGPVRGTGFDREARNSAALRHEVAGLGLTASVETGRALLYDREGLQALRGGYSRYDYDRMAIALDRRFGRVALGFEASRLAEKDTVLGARFSPALGGRGATSWFVDVDAAYDAGDGWTLGATMRTGFTFARAGGALTRGATLKSNAFAFDVGKRGFARSDDRLAFRIAQPLRVEGGRYDLTLPVGYDYETIQTTFGVQRLNLAPKGREVDVEAIYGRPLWTGWISGNLFFRQEPGNLSYAPDDVGAAVRFSMEF